MNRTLPHVILAARPGLSLVEWAAGRRDDLQREIDTFGALLFRGFDVGGQTGLRDFVDAISVAGALDYTYRSTPRTAVGDKVYTATEYPPSQTIPLHNECAYQRVWPMRLFFVCVTAAARGGETPIADTVRVTARIDAGVRDRFRRLGVLYVRNYHKDLDVPWQTVFQTEDRDEVARFCAENGLEVEWRANGSLRTKQLCQGFATHPRTGQEIWMNQAHLFHVSSLGERVQKNLLRLLAPEDLPRNTFYGDGSPFEPDVLQHIREAFEAEEVAFPWQPADVLVIDNMLVSHGRRPFSGERRILVAMSESYSPSASEQQAGAVTRRYGAGA